MNIYVVSAWRRYHLANCWPKNTTTFVEHKSKAIYPKHAFLPNCSISEWRYPTCKHVAKCRNGEMVISSNFFNITKQWRAESSQSKSFYSSINADEKNNNGPQLSIFAIVCLQQEAHLFCGVQSQTFGQYWSEINRWTWRFYSNEPQALCLNTGITVSVSDKLRIAISCSE